MEPISQLHGLVRLGTPVVSLDSRRDLGVVVDPGDHARVILLEKKAIPQWSDHPGGIHCPNDIGTRWDVDTTDPTGAAHLAYWLSAQLGARFSEHVERGCVALGLDLGAALEEHRRATSGRIPKQAMTSVCDAVAVAWWAQHQEVKP